MNLRFLLIVEIVMQGKSSEVVERVKDVVISVAEEAHSSSEGREKTRFSRSVNNKKPHEAVPKVHEDYYGPKTHNPRHH